MNCTPDHPRPHEPTTMDLSKVTWDKEPIQKRFYDALEGAFYECILPGHKGRPSWTIQYGYGRRSLPRTLLRLRLTLSWVEGTKVSQLTDQQVLQKILYYYRKYNPKDFNRRKYIIMDIEVKNPFKYLVP